MIKTQMTWRDVREAASTFPITALYVVGVVILLLMQRTVIGVGTGIATLSLIAVMSLHVAISRELRLVHILVNSQHEALVARINQLLDTMDKADVEVPEGKDDPKGVPKS